MTAWLYAKKDDVTIMRPIVEMDDYIAPPENKNDFPVFTDPTMNFRMIYDPEIVNKLQSGSWRVCISILDNFIGKYSFDAESVSVNVFGPLLETPLLMGWKITPTTPFLIQSYVAKKKIKIRVKGRQYEGRT